MILRLARLGALLALLMPMSATLAQRLPADLAQAERDFRVQMKLQAYPQVRYLDADGRQLDFAGFLAKAAGGMEYAVSRNATTHVATVRLRKPRAPGEQIVVQPGPWRGMDVPEFSGTTLDGKRVDNAMFAGRWTMLSFYFADCAPCIKEVPALNGFQAAHPDVQVLSVTFETEAEGRDFAQRYGLRWPILARQQAWIDALGIAGYPNIALVGPQGTVVSLWYPHNKALAVTRARQQLARQGGAGRASIRPPDITAQGMGEWLAMAQAGRAADMPAAATR